LSAPRVLLLDIETAPSLGWVWQKWETDVIEFKKQWFVLCFAYKWLDEKKIRVRALPDCPGYNKNKECDKHLMQGLWELLDAADVVVAHNGDRFDLRKSNARFVAHGLIPPSPYKSVDTLKIARKYFKFDSNKLDDLGQYLGVGRKLAHTGARLWFGCMNGERKAWALMKRYNATDVALLERVYLKLRPWATTHPNLTFYNQRHQCPVCLSSHVKDAGFHYLRTGKRQRARCLERKCGHRFSYGPLIKP
jgi:hypothetical protein